MKKKNLTNGPNKRPNKDQTLVTESCSCKALFLLREKIDITGANKDVCTTPANVSMEWREEIHYSLTKTNGLTDQK